MAPNQQIPQNILVIDDDITSLDLISYIFEDRGFAVHRAASGDSAIKQVVSLDPKLFVIDLMMPGIDGVETIRQIRELGFRSQPIIAFTAVDDQELHREAEAAGANIVLTKPCPTATLVRHVKNLLGD